MTTLTYGLKLPQSGDKGATLWAALQGDISQLDAHTHDGVTSPKIPIQNFVSTKQNITAAGWATYDTNTGHYRQQVVIPAGFTYDDFTISFRNTVTGSILYIGVTKIDNLNYYIYSIDNTLTVTAVYGV